MTKTTRIVTWYRDFLVVDRGGIIIIATFDWNRLKPTINQKVSTELNRPFAIRGDLGVVWERQKEKPAGEAGSLAARSRRRHHSRQPAGYPDVTMVHLPRVEATLARWRC
jgi:uncharacterized protein involved in outer membrane biogenesis